MAITTIPGRGFYLPAPNPIWNAPTFASQLGMSVANAKIAWVFAAPKTGNIAALAWRTTAVSVAGTLDLRLETVDTTTGAPTGTLVGTNTNVSLAIVGGNANSQIVSTLTATAAVTLGQMVAWVPTNPPSSPANLSAGGLSMPGGSTNMPYGLTFNGTSWTKVPTAWPLIGCQYDDGNWYPIDGALFPGTALTATNFSNSSTPDCRGLRFKLPVPVRVCGAWVSIDLDGDCHVRLVTTAYNQGAGTGILATASLDANVRGTSGGSVYFVTFDSAADLAKDTYYRLIVEPSSGTNLSVYDITLATLAQLGGIAGGGVDFHLTTAKDPTGDGDWTNYDSGTFRSPYMGLQIDGVDGATSGGGGSFPFIG